MFAFIEIKSKIRKNSRKRILTLYNEGQKFNGSNKIEQVED